MSPHPGARVREPKRSSRLLRVYAPRNATKSPPKSTCTNKVEVKILITNSIAAVTLVWSFRTDSTVKPLNWRNGHKSPVPPYQKKSTITKVAGTSRFAPNRCEKDNLEVPLTFVHWVLHNIAVMVCLKGVAAVVKATAVAHLNTNRVKVSRGRRVSSE